MFLVASRFRVERLCDPARAGRLATRNRALVTPEADDVSGADATEPHFGELNHWSPILA